MSIAGATSLIAPAALTRHPALPWLLSLLVGAAGALALFPVPVLLGTAPYWDNPRGIVGGSWADMAQASSGYAAYVRDEWRWPLFQAAGLGRNGVGIMFTDSVPVVALLGRLLFLATGRVVPLYGLWSLLCVVGMGLACTGLVRALGARSLGTAVAASVIGVSMPALLARWGHLALMAQGIVPLALAVHVRLRTLPRLRTGTVLGPALTLCLGSLLVHPYLLMMSCGIMAATILQAGTDRRLPWRAAAGVLAVLAAALGAAMLAMGYGTSAGASSDKGFGVFSANLMSPFLPYQGVLPGGTGFAMDGTGGQYEGAAFLGAGVLLLMLCAGRGLLAFLARGVRRDPWLLAVITAFTALAVSNEVYAGGIHLFSIPLPDEVQWAGGVVRASGRFAWVATYLMAALAIAAAARLSCGKTFLLSAAALQWVSAEPLRLVVRGNVAAMPQPLLDRAAWQSALAGADQLVVDPPFACLPDGPSKMRMMMVAAELQLLAAQAAVPTNTLYAARTAPDCMVPPQTPRSLVAYLRPAAPSPGLTCRAGPIMMVCGAVSQELPPSLVNVELEEAAHP